MTSAFVFFCLGVKQATIQTTMLGSFWLAITAMAFFLLGKAYALGLLSILIVWLLAARGAASHDQMLDDVAEALVWVRTNRAKLTAPGTEPAKTRLSLRRVRLSKGVSEQRFSSTMRLVHAGDSSRNECGATTLTAWLQSVCRSTVHSSASAASASRPSSTKK